MGLQVNSPYWFQRKILKSIELWVTLFRRIMGKRVPVCNKCGRTLLITQVEIDASGEGYTLGISGIPAFRCDICDTSLNMGIFKDQ